LWRTAALPLTGSTGDIGRSSDLKNVCLGFAVPADAAGVL